MTTMTTTPKMPRKFIDIQGTMEELEALHRALCLVISNPKNLTSHVQTESFDIMIVRRSSTPSIEKEKE